MFKNDKRKISNITALVLGLALMIFIGLMLFWRLGETPIQQTDEAYHGTNAYEMVQSGNWIINTYKGEVDYFNSKPPLTLWCIASAYEIFGGGYELCAKVSLSGSGYDNVYMHCLLFS